MNNKFGADGRYRDTRQPLWWQSDQDRALRSPDQEFETSTNYREPPDNFAEPLHLGQPSERRDRLAGREPKGHTGTDERIHEAVCEGLSRNDEVDATELRVTVESGEVILEGSVETRRMLRLAEALAAEVPGVLDVRNTVSVRGE